MARIRKKHSPAFKAQVALEAAKPTRTVAELARPYQAHPVQIGQWKKQLLDGIEALFQNGSSARRPDPEKLQAELYEQLGRLQMELARVKQNPPREVEAERALIEPNHHQLSIRRRCELPGLDRASYDHLPAAETIEDPRLMRRIDGQYPGTPSFGSRRMAIVLSESGGEVNRKRVGRPMGLMGLEAIHPGPRTAVNNPDHEAYPHLLRGVAIGRRDQVWSSGITSIPMRQGFMYSTAVIDRYSRYVLSRSLSDGLDGRSCPGALGAALRGGKPGIFNADRGVQYAARSFTGRLESAGVSVSMDGRGRALGDVFVERLRRSSQYEDVYLKDCRSVAGLVSGLTSWFRFYNRERPHQGLEYRTPARVYQESGWASG